jgi:hypothetical protein|tara:strand:- start:60 stop:1211 length:1152 start_codon:yes stop_codon:yes gene_type:complete
LADQNFRVKNGLEVGIGGTILVSKSDGKVGIGITNPAEKLDVDGTVKATSFVGNGSGLTNLNVPGISTSGTTTFTNLTVTGISTLGTLNVSGITTISNDLELTRGSNTSSLTRNLVIGGARNNGSYFASLQFKNYDSNNGAVDYVAAEIRGSIPAAANDGGELIFLTAADGATSQTERLRIDSSGRLMLGTTTEGNPSSDNLTVADTGACGITIRSGTSSNGGLHFSDGTSGDDEFRGYVVYEHSNNALRLGTNADERMRISSSGNVGINQTNPSEKLDVNGNVKAIDFNTTSDQNLKTNIHTIENPLEKIAEIRGVNFDWKETQKPSVGVIAQEIEKVLPELVNDSGTKTVNYNGLIGLLIEVVKEQQTQIESLNERLSKLE